LYLHDEFSLHRGAGHSDLRWLDFLAPIHLADVAGGLRLQLSPRFSARGTLERKQDVIECKPSKSHTLLQADKKRESKRLTSAFSCLKKETFDEMAHKSPGIHMSGQDTLFRLSDDRLGGL
jgi:hypothetical protein